MDYIAPKKENAMGVILKYVLYIMLILLVYIIARDIYHDKINNNTTIEEAKNQITDSARDMVDDGMKAVKADIKSLQK